MASKKNEEKKVPRRPSVGLRGKKYRMLRVGQVMKERDQFQSLLDYRWKIIYPHAYGVKWNPVDWQPVRREVVKRRGK